jgi:hypothetical protein
MKLDSLDKNALHMALDKLITEYEKKEPEIGTLTLDLSVSNAHEMADRRLHSETYNWGVLFVPQTTHRALFVDDAYSKAEIDVEDE